MEKLIELKKTELIFDINGEPPTLDQINNRLLMLPDYNIKAEKNKKKANKLSTLLSSLFFILIELTIWFNFSMLNVRDEIIVFFLFTLVMFFLSCIFGVFLEKTITNQELQNLNKESNYQQNCLTEIREDCYVYMAEMYKKSKICENYGKKVKIQGRSFCFLELELFREQIEKEEIESKQNEQNKSLEKAKQVLFNDKEIEKYII